MSKAMQSQGPEDEASQGDKVYNDDTNKHELTTTSIKDHPDNHTNSNGLKTGDINKTKTHDDDDLPIDKGWAWVVLAGAFLYLMMMAGLKKNYGLFFVAFQARFEADASTTSLLTTLQASTASIVSLLNMTIGLHYMSNRTSIAIGSILMFAANISNAFAPNIHVLMANFVIDGLGGAMVHSPVLAILVEYFKEKRGFANGLAFSGASVGNFIFAPVYTYLFEHYGYTGTLLILAAILLHICVSASLFRPINSFRRKPVEKYETKNEIKFQDEGTQVNDKLLPKVRRENQTNVFLTIQSSNGHANSYTDITWNGAMQKQKGGLSPLLPRVRAWSTGAKQRNTETREPTHTFQKPFDYVVEHLSRSEIALYGNDMAEIIGSSFNVEEEKVPKNLNPLQKIHKFLKKTLLLVFDTSLLKNKVLLLSLVMCAMLAPSMLFMVICLVPNAKDLGIPSPERGILLAILGIMGLISRLSMAFLVDKKFLKLTTILGIAALINGTMVHFTPLFTSYHSLIGYAIVLGLTCDIYQAMFSVVLVEYLTLPKLKSALGFTIMCQGVSMASTFPLVGWLRDITGNYLASYHLLGTMAYIGAIASFSIPIVHNKFYVTIKKECDASADPS